MQTINDLNQESAVPTLNPHSTQPSTGITQISASAPPPQKLRSDLVAIADTLAVKVRDCQINALDWGISATAALQECRDQLSVADFYQIMRSGRIPVGIRTAQEMIRVARNKAIRDPERTHQLPDAMSILTVIAGLPVPVLEHALDTGLIQPKTTLKEARAFHRKWLANSASQTSAPAFQAKLI